MEALNTLLRDKLVDMLLEVIPDWDEVPDDVKENILKVATAHADSIAGGLKVLIPEGTVLQLSTTPEGTITDYYVRADIDCTLDIGA